MNQPSIAHQVRQSLLDRFLSYVAIDTQSDLKSTSYPSTEKQLTLLRLLHDQLLELGVTCVTLEPKGYVLAQIPATAGYEDRPALGLIAHVDTSPDFSGQDVRPQIIEDYAGEAIPLGTTAELTVREFPELMELLGHTLITTDGTTLLGADDKAGVAEIMEAVRYIMAHPELPHGKICIGFTPDEEIGAGVDHFDVKKFGADFAFTVDGGREGELEYENFNAASAKVVATGRSIHPGYAKGKLVNAIEVIYLLHASLPHYARPEFTEGYEGFYHLTHFSGDVEHAEAEYIIRDHDRGLFEEKKTYLEQIAAEINAAYKRPVIQVEIKDSYYNMYDQVAPHAEMIERAKQAMAQAGVTPLISPIRGGTDGARLSYMGLPCPNLFTGGANFHGKYEYASLDTMCRAVETLVHLVTEA
ncbi:peptidase T [uncultured Porphyromonas sp.]|uniref:peptidase T n=1 Tax=uncultured Porphyromonas sp. TaxID=159274 RepID=UPI002606C55C|nr:peptidase T [uncultured Porphyromonas sp.]